MKFRVSRKSILWVAVIAIALLPVYVFSYCFVLPFLESSGYDNLGNAIYEPVELLRNSSDLIWRYTEIGYARFGGKTPSKDRYLLTKHRRYFLFYSVKGRVYCECNYKGGIIDGRYRMYDLNGTLLLNGIYKEGKPYEGVLFELSKTPYVLSEYHNGNPTRSFTDREKLSILDPRNFPKLLGSYGNEANIQQSQINKDKSPIPQALGNSNSGETYYTVSEGDTWKDIATMHAVSEDELKSANKGILNLKEGMEIIIPPVSIQPPKDGK